jgi:4-hydroxy-3-polyprenylbenzoate decarboxylase
MTGRRFRGKTDSFWSETVTYLDLREWIADMDERGDLRRVEGANVEWEIGAATDLYMRRTNRPALLFDNIPGFRPGWRVVSNALTATRRIALSMGMPAETSERDLVLKWRDLAANWPVLPPEVCQNGPVFQNVWEGSQIDLTAFPAPHWHPQDGGRYIGTGCAVIIKDPDSDYVNLGCYRVMIQDGRRLGLMITVGRQGRMLIEKHWVRGEDCPVAITFGQDPLILMVAGTFMPYGASEYDIVGGVSGQPVPVVLGPRTGLPLPAYGEIVVEGVMRPGEIMDEGPFGEWTGYYAGGRRPEPVMEVTAVYFRDNPVILGTIPGIPPSDDTYTATFINSAMIWDQVEKAGIRGVQGVWLHEAGGSRMWNTVVIKQLYPGHAKQAGHVAAMCGAGGYSNRWVVVVDDDIDPTDTDQVIWAMCTRVDPREDVDFIHRSWSSPLDPMSYPPDYRRFNSKVVVDACRPFERTDFPAVAEASPEAKAQVLARFPWMREDVK